MGSIVAPLKKHFDVFSVLNGVHMATSFDGHDQNKLYTLTGNPFGGDTYLAQLGRQGSLIDYVQLGNLMARPNITNKARSIRLTPQSAQQLSLSLQSGAVAKANPVLDAYVDSRLVANGGDRPESGLFADGVAKMREGLKGSRQIEDRLRAIQFNFEQKSPMIQSLEVSAEYFRRGIARVALITADEQLDAHAALLASEQPQKLAQVVATIDEVFTFLKGQAPTSPRNGSLLDETTIIVTSEFSRTMRQKGLDIAATGTDHNALNNSVLIGGKGVRGGQIIGGSDYQAADETLSAVHSRLDPEALKFMGSPFDFAAERSRPSAQTDAEYRMEDYLTFGSVANTLYRLFNADPAHAWKLSRNGPPAPFLKGILL